MESGSSIDVNTKKYYRVVVEGIDPSQANEDSFAIKLSMKTRSTPQRVRTVIRNLPYTVKSGLSATAANKLKAIIEGIGGIVRIETHFVTPGKESEAYRHHQETNGESQSDKPGSAEPEVEQIFICPECGHLAEEGATFCTVCHRKFRGPGRRAGLGDRIPEDNPLNEDGAASEPEISGEPETSGELTLTEVWRRSKIPIIFVGVGVLLFLLLK
ncbi:MAG: zinc ribbon domain-containing protein [bacterium]|nr:zinc ribbon domain-containing protein [bacterium]